MTKLVSQRWFQLHLITAIAVMFAASGLLALSRRPHTQNCLTWGPIHNLATPSRQKFFINHVQDRDFGWPFVAKWKSITAYVPNDEDLLVEYEDFRELSESIEGYGNWELDLDEFQTRAPNLSARIGWNFESPRCSIKNGPWLWESILLDAFVACGILAVVAFACEWYVRRR
jgi:hypothetical protein